MTQLPSVNYDVAQWLIDHAIECIVWCGVQVRRNLHRLPHAELKFHYERLVLDPAMVRIQEMKTLVAESVPVEVVDGDGDLFNDKGNFDNLDAAGAPTRQTSQTSVDMTPLASPSVHNFNCKINLFLTQPSQHVPFVKHIKFFITFT